MRVIITGSKGQLGTALQEVLKEEELFPVDLPELDLISYQATRDYFNKIRPELVIHCAAKTDVDGCEIDPDFAYLSNVLATKNVVNACQSHNAALVYVSTDYVFDGQSDRPYREYDPCNPLSVYGRTKWQGEQIVQMHLQRFYIVRTAWLFGDIGHNFIRTILRLAEEKNNLQIVDDQVGSPTYARDLAEVISRLISLQAHGIYHVTNEGSCSWYDFAAQILKMGNKNNITLEPIKTSSLNRPAPRPHFSVLSKAALKGLGITTSSYKDALERFFKTNGL